MARRMAAWCVHAYGPRGASELRLESARVPALRAPDELLVRVHTSSLNPLDLSMIEGYGSRVFKFQRALEGVEGLETDVEFPLVAGRDWAGEVVAAGPRARLRPGARVWGVLPPHRSGAHAQYVRTRDCWTGEAPQALSGAEAGSALYAGLTACAALRAAGVRPGDARGSRVLLLGAGGVGHAALQLLVVAGAEVVVGCSGDVCDRALSLGARIALDRHSPDYEQRLQDAGPYAAVVDAAGLGGAGAARLPTARYVTLTSPLLRQTDARGLAVGTLSAAADLLAHTAAMYKSPASSIPSTSGSPSPSPSITRTTAVCPPHVRWAFFSPEQSDIELLRRLADNGKFTVEVERVFPWWEGDRAYARAAEGHARGKIVLDWTLERPADAPALAPAAVSASAHAAA